MRISGQSMPELIAMIGGANGGDRLKAARILKTLGPMAREAIPTLVAVLESTDEASHWAAVDVLEVVVPGSDAVPALAGVLCRNRDERTRWAAARVLMNMGAEARDALPNLKIAAREDRNDLVRKTAAQALDVIRAAVERDGS